MLATLGLILASGCSSPPPCEVSPGEVEQARTELQAARSAADEAAAEQQQLEGQIANLRSKVVSDQEIEQMESRLEELRKGSGR